MRPGSCAPNRSWLGSQPSRACSCAIMMSTVRMRAGSFGCRAMAAATIHTRSRSIGRRMGTKVFGFQTRKAMPHEVLMVDSSPKDQVQPKVQRHDYSKPGDQIAQPKPRLFDVAGKRAIAIDDAVFAEPWSIDNVRFSEDSSEVFCLYNRRGHQLLRLCAIHTSTGALRTIVEETTSTFVDYSQKTFCTGIPAVSRCFGRVNAMAIIIFTKLLSRAAKCGRSRAAIGWCAKSSALMR